MSIDRYVLVDESGQARRVEFEELPEQRQDMIYEMAQGVESLYVFESAEEARSAYKQWRRQPCERITLTIDGVQQDQGEGVSNGRIPFEMMEFAYLYDVEKA